jgi:hypothetical protein
MIISAPFLERRFMSQIVISKSAIEKIIADPKFSQSRRAEADQSVPLLHYYQRSYLTRDDGIIVEYGDGFGLTFVKSDDLKETADITYKSLDIGDGNCLVIGGPQSVLSGSFSIEWKNSKFTLEPTI